MHTNWVSSGLMSSDILSNFNFASMGFRMSCFTLSMAFFSDFLCFRRNEKISAGLNFSFSTLTANPFINHSTLSASSLWLTAASWTFLFSSDWAFSERVTLSSMSLKMRQKRSAVILLSVSSSSTFLFTQPGCMSASSRHVMWLVVMIRIRPSCDPTPLMTFKREDKDTFSLTDLLIQKRKSVTIWWEFSVSASWFELTLSMSFKRIMQQLESLLNRLFRLAMLMVERLRI